MHSCNFFSEPLLISPAVAIPLNPPIILASSQHKLAAPHAFLLQLELLLSTFVQGQSLLLKFFRQPVMTTPSHQHRRKSPLKSHWNRKLTYKLNGWCWSRHLHQRQSQSLEIWMHDAWYTHQWGVSPTICWIPHIVVHYPIFQAWQKRKVVYTIEASCQFPRIPVSRPHLSVHIPVKPLF